MDGKVVMGFSGEGIISDIVQAVMDENDVVGPFNRKCAEVNVISKAVEKNYDVSGAFICVVQVSSGATAKPCIECAPLLTVYGIAYIPIP